MSEQKRRRLGEGGAKERRSSIDGARDDPALQKENRQAVKNQGKAAPEDYPDRSITPV